VVDFLSFTISFATASTTQDNYPPFPSVISMLCMDVSKSISVEIFFFYHSKHFHSSQTVQASSKAAHAKWWSWLNVEVEPHPSGGALGAE